MSMANTFLLIGFLCFEALMWIFFGELSQRFRLSPVYVYGLGRGCLAGGMMVGTLLPVIATSWAESTPLGEHIIIVLMLLVMVIAYALLPRERDMEALVAPCPLVRVAITTQELKDFPLEAAVAQESVATSLTVGTTQPSQLAQASAGQGGEEGAPSEGAADSAIQAANAASAAGAAQATGNPLPSGAQSAPGEGTAPTSPIAHAAPGDAQTSASENTPTEEPVHAVATQGAAQVGQTASSAVGAPAPDDGPRRGGGRFRGKCETVANTFLLSSRETEVLFLLAKGHNAAYIQEQLYISEGTAKTHIRHIYRKLDVHNQQELMRIVEDAEPAQ